VYEGYKINVSINYFFNSHCSILGNSGAGKSCSVASLLQKLFLSSPTPPKNAGLFFFDAYGEYTNAFGKLHEQRPELNYKSYPFIYSQMPDVIAASDVILSRAGANSIWECATLGKPMVLVPLCGSGTRGDQEDNASFFEKSCGAFVLARENATSEKLKECLDVMSDASKRESFVQANYSLTKNTNPAEKIANLIYNEFNL
jgi:UDP-N-acetylglucosamine:LPS N-acetylglucosamine transferase